MKPFDGIWSEERITDLVNLHKGRSHPETAELLSKKWNCYITRDSVKNKYTRLQEIVDVPSAAIKVEPAKNRDFFSRTQSDERLKMPRVYFVTSAIAGATLNTKFLRSIEKFLEDRGAKLVVLPMRGVVSRKEQYSEEVLEELSDSFYTEYIFNYSLEAYDLCLSPKQANPLVGTARIAQKRSCLIVASPKQNMETTPVAVYNIPHIIHSTGTITNPNYDNTRIGKIAIEDHIVGGLIVEVEDQTVFHLRQVQADKDGSFYDLDKKYTPKGVETATAEAFIPGDIHNGSQDPTAMKAWDEVIKTTRPKTVVFHDLFDSRSVSHHEDHNLSKKSNRPEEYRLLKNELDLLGEFLTNQKKKYPWVNFYAAASNHPEHLDSFLDSGRFIFDHHNYRLALELAIYRVDGKNPIEEYLDKNFGQRAKIKWLTRSDSLVISGVEVGAHGDLGPNGSRGSLIGVERSYRNSVVGHSHTPRIYRSAWQVGTSTMLRLSYNRGPSSWLHASCLVYKNGQRQLIISIGGKWRV